MLVKENKKQGELKMGNKFSGVSDGFNGGGYPVVYVDDGTVYCGDCASKEDKVTQERLQAHPHMEGSSLYCDECGTEIESAYGDPEED